MSDLASKIVKRLQHLGVPLDYNWALGVITEIILDSEREKELAPTYRSTMAESLDMLPVEDVFLKDRISRVKDALQAAALEMLRTSDSLTPLLKDTPASRELKLATGELRKLLEKK